MKAFKVKNLRRFSNFIRILVIVLFLNSLLSLFVFLAGSYNIFVYNFQKNNKTKQRKKKPKESH